MGAKNSFVSQLADDQSLASNFNTDPVLIGSKTNVIGINVSTASVNDNTGAFTVEHRMYDADTRKSSDWASLTLSSTVQLADADLTTLIYLQNLPPGQIRVSFAAAGGTPDGTADIWISAMET